MPLHLRPVGPLPEAVYWRRRAGLLAVVVLVLVLLSRCGGSDEPVRTQAAPTPAATTAAVPLPTTDPTPDPTPSATATASPSASAGGSCTDSALSAAATPDRGSYPAGTRPVLTLSVRNAGTTACARALGRGAVELLVYSGSDRIWSSDDCAPGGPPGVQVLAPQQLFRTTLTWSAKRSRPGCTGGEAILPGTYRVVGRVGSLRTGSTSFVVTG